MGDVGLDHTWISYFKPNISIALVQEATVYAANAVPPWVSHQVLTWLFPAHMNKVERLSSGGLLGGRGEMQSLSRTWISYFMSIISTALVQEATVYAANAVPPWVSLFLVYSGMTGV